MAVQHYRDYGDEAKRRIYPCEGGKMGAGDQPQFKCWRPDNVCPICGDGLELGVLVAPYLEKAASEVRVRHRLQDSCVYTRQPAHTAARYVSCRLHALRHASLHDYES
jgi:hypothetical protein